MPDETNATRRPHYGAAILRGLTVIEELVEHLDRSGALALHRVQPQERRDVRRALRYLRRLEEWRRNRDRVDREPGPVPAGLRGSSSSSAGVD